MNPPFVLPFIVGAIVLGAAVCDVRTRKLPNWLTVPTFAVGVIFWTVWGATSGDATWYAGGLDGLLFSLGGFATGFFPLLVVWMIGGSGAGDVKLMGALGAWLGPMLTVYVLVGSTFVAILVSGGAVIYATFTAGGFGRILRRRRNPTSRVSNERASTSEATRQEATRRRAKRRLLPFGIPVAVATWGVLIWKILLVGS